MLKAFCKRRKGTLVLLVIALAAMAFAWVNIQAVPGTFQHVYAAPQPAAAAEDEKETNSGLRDARLKTRELETELEGACEDMTLYALSQPASVSIPDGGKSVSARLVGVEESWFYLKSPVLLNGRQLYPDECVYGERVAMVDEQLAVALFQYAEPLGEEIEIGGQRYRIVGVIKAGKRVGDQMDYSLYVPLRSLEDTNVALTALVYEARPVQGAGGWSAFQSAAQKLGDGTTISLVKERMNAAMPMRMLFTLLGMAMALWGVRWMNRRARALPPPITTVCKRSMPRVWWALRRYACCCWRWDTSPVRRPWPGCLPVWWNRCTPSPNGCRRYWSSPRTSGPLSGMYGRPLPPWWNTARRSSCACAFCAR